MTAYSDAEIDAIAGWLKEGHSASQIASLFSKSHRKVSRNAIIGAVHRNNRLASIGLAAPTRQRKPTSEMDRDTIMRMWREGASMPVIAAKLGRSAGAVENWLRRNRDLCPRRGVVGRPKGRADSDARKPRAKRDDQAEIANLPKRPVEAMISGMDAPLAKGSEPQLLTEIPHRGCHFPVSGEGEQTRFCAVEVSALDWQPTRVSGCYCRMHRALAHKVEPREPRPFRMIGWGKAA